MWTLFSFHTVCVPSPQQLTASKSPFITNKKTNYMNKSKDKQVVENDLAGHSWKVFLLEKMPHLLYVLWCTKKLNTRPPWLTTECSGSPSMSSVSVVTEREFAYTVLLSSSPFDLALQHVEWEWWMDETLPWKIKWERARQREKEREIVM